MPIGADWFLICFFFNDTATTEIYTLSLHDALPIYGGQQGRRPARRHHPGGHLRPQAGVPPRRPRQDRKSTRLNSSHANISYAVFCLKKKNNKSTDFVSSHVYIFGITPVPHIAHPST